MYPIYINGYIKHVRRTTFLFEKNKRLVQYFINFISITCARIYITLYIDIDFNIFLNI